MLLGSAITYAITQRSVTFPTSGLIVGIGVGIYADSGATQNLTSISWGSIEPGGNAVRTCYVKNTGNTQINLTMSTQDWNPAGISSQISVVWDREGVAVGPGQLVLASISLSVLPSAPGTSFSFNIRITGSG